MKKMTSLLLAATAAAGALVGCSNDEEATAGHEQWDTTVAPKNVSWSDAQTRGIKVPSSKDDGPKNTDPVPHGWAPSPQGAVMAAINGQVYMSTAGEEVWPEVSKLMLAPGQGRDQWAQARSLMDIDGDVKNPPQFKGFKFSEFSKDKAVVVIVAEYPHHGRLGYPVQLDRSSGDWRIVVPPQGQEPDLVGVKDAEFESFVKFEG